MFSSPKLYFLDTSFTLSESYCGSVWLVSWTIFVIGLGLEKQTFVKKQICEMANIDFYSFVKEAL